MLKKSRFSLLRNGCSLLFAFILCAVLIAGPGATSAQAAGKTSPVKLAPGTKSNINKADQATLEKLPGIGPRKAKSTINGRPYKTINDVMKVSDIKRNTFDAIKEFIVVE